ncbi:MAG: DUF308 domain-containing protein [Clostridia bacterium]|nr:DUF308 domain-containing protein [Clostridia bacterium]
MAKKSNSELFSSLLYIIIGVLLIVFRSQTLGWAMTIMGALFVLSGILDLVRTNWAGGAVSLIIGIAILVLGWTATKIVLLVLGILIAIKGIIAVVSVLTKSRKNILEIIFPIISIVIGLMLAFGNGLDVLIVIAGVLLTADGILGLIGSLIKK